MCSNQSRALLDNGHHKIASARRLWTHLVLPMGGESLACLGGRLTQTPACEVGTNQQLQSQSAKQNVSNLFVCKIVLNESRVRRHLRHLRPSKVHNTRATQVQKWKCDSGETKGECLRPLVVFAYTETFPAWETIHEQRVVSWLLTRLPGHFIGALFWTRAFTAAAFLWYTTRMCARVCVSGCMAVWVCVCPLFPFGRSDFETILTKEGRGLALSVSS